VNAVFEKDFVAYSASARFQLQRFAVAAVMGVTLLVLVVRAYATKNYADIGTSVFDASVTIGLGLVIITVPASFSTVLVHARAGATLPVLLTTPLSTLSIAGGAFSARTAAFVALLLATWPPIASSLLFGGVRGSQLVAATATLVATGMLVAAPAFVASGFARRTSVAVVSAYLAAVTTIALLYLVGERVAAGGAWSASAISPLHAASAAMDARFAATRGPYVLLAWSSALATIAVAAVAWRLAREGRGTADAARVAALSGRQCRPLRLANPVLDRETRTALLRGGAGRGLLALLVLAEAAFFVLAGARHECTYLPYHFAVLAMECFLIVLAVTASGATALAAEREGRTLDLIRASPLTPRDIVAGKLLGLLRNFAPCLAVPLLHLAFGAALGVFSWAAVPLTAVTGAVAMSVWAVFALSQSLDQTDPNRAVRRTMGAFAILAVLLAANVGIPVNGVFRDVDPWLRAAVAFGANPVALTLLPAAALRTGGSDAANTVVTAPSGGDLVFAAIFGVIWIALYAGLGTFVYRRLFHMYRTRVDG
jgi:hypothetical protein